MLVLIRGAGDIATGIALRLYRTGIQVVMTDLPRPTAIRRTVCFSPAITDAPVVVGIGPGFTAGEDCHAVVETMRGHTLGRAIYQGSALPNTNIPGLIGGYAGERVLRAPADGIFTRILDIGDEVQPGDIAGTVNGQPMKCTIGGVVRGILPSGTPVHLGMKSGDVDPRCKPEYCTTASDKALAVGGGALEAILHLTGALR